MNEIAILDTIERYIRGEMQPEERVYFEQQRKISQRGSDGRGAYDLPEPDEPIQ